jgi:SH3 domain protein
MAEGDRKKLSKELTDIKLVSSKEIALNEQNQLLVKHNHMLQEERDVLRANVDDLQNNTKNQSFLYGGLLVFLGAILTAIIPRIRGRKRLSEWH